MGGAPCAGVDGFRCDGSGVLGVDNDGISQGGLTGHGGRPPVGREKLNRGDTTV